MRFTQFSKKLLFVPVAAGALLCSCMDATEETPNTLVAPEESSFTYDINGNVNFFDATYQEDLEYDEKEFKNTITINFKGSEAPAIDGLDALNGEVEIITNEEKGKAHLLIKAEKKVNYVLTGKSNDASLLISSKKKFKLTLKDLELSNDKGVPAICSQTKKRCFIETIGTATIKDAEMDEQYSLDSRFDNVEDTKGAIFSEGELIFCGSGTLNVEGRCKHAIASDQYVRINEGANVNITGSKKDGIQTNDAVLIYGGKLNIKNVGKLFNLHSNQYPNPYSSRKMNGIQCEKGYIVVKGGEINISSLGYGIYANYDDFSKSDIMTEKSFIYIDGGKINIKTTEARGHGISAKNHIIIRNGEINITAKGAEAKGIEADSNEDFATGDELEYGNITLAGGTVNLFCTDKVVDPAGKFNIVGGTLNAIGGSEFTKDQVLGGSKAYAVASFADVKAGEAIKINGKDAGIAGADLATAKVVVIGSGEKVPVEIGTKKADAVVAK
jgi:hypothetical protein